LSAEGTPVVGPQLGEHLVDPERGCDGPAPALVVAGEHRELADAEPPQRRKRLDSLGPRLVAKREQGDDARAVADDDGGLARLLQPLAGSDAPGASSSTSRAPPTQTSRFHRCRERVIRLGTVEHDDVGHLGTALRQLPRLGERDRADASEGDAGRAKRAGL
jgi:hypothetical protein